MQFNNDLYNFDWLCSAATETPNKTAIKDKNKQYSYNELYKAANILATLLCLHNAKKSDRVCIIMDSCSDFVVSIIACIKIGAVFVPISPNNPKERLKFVLSNCAPSVIITSGNSDVDNIAFDLGIPVVNIEKAEHGKSSANIQKTRVNPKDLAYIIYTSGSTGMPKGVAIRWESIDNYIKDTVERLGFNTKTVSLCLAPFYFDGALTSILGMLYCRGTLIIESSFIRPKRLLEIITLESVTDIGCSPSHLELLSECLNNISCDLKTIGVGGESFSKTHIKNIIENHPDIKILNRYGPTETTVVVASYQITKEDIYNTERIPIGKPINNVTFKAVNDNGEPIKEGEIAELLIGGIQVMECYWNDVETTNSVFEINHESGEKLYHSGDLVTVDDKGNYIFISRKDDMVKTSGYRIFPSEVELALKKIEFIQNVKCVAVDHKTSIIAFIVVDDKISKSNIIHKIRVMLSNYIPSYMQPKEIRIVDEIPTDAIGKTNKFALTNLLT